MRKYFELIKIGFKEQIAYRFDVMSGAFLSIFKILLAYILWSAIFKGKTVIGGYTFEMMMTYYLAVAFFMQLEKSKDMVWQFYNEIRQGLFTKYVVRPINPILVFMSLSFSKTFYVVGINGLAFIGWILVFRKQLYTPDADAIAITAVFVILGLLLMTQLNYLITMFSFKVIEIAGLFFATLDIISFLSGELIPLSFLPEVVERVVMYLPFYYILYYPASLLLGMNQGNILQGLIIVSSWIIGLVILNQFMFKRLFRYYEGVGV